MSGGSTKRASISYIQSLEGGFDLTNASPLSPQATVLGDTKARP
jgi:hypothetical protein